MGYLQEISACKNAARKAGILEDILIKAIEQNNNFVMDFMKTQVYPNYLIFIKLSKEFGHINEEVVKVFEDYNYDTNK